MKYIFLSLFVLYSLNTKCQTYTADLSTAKAKWTGYGEIGGFVQTGTIELKEGGIFTEAGLVTNALISFSSKSISHENKDLEKHLKAKDFFYVRKYPKITFELLELKGNEAIGKLEIRGISHLETVNISIQRQDSYISIKGKARIDRTKYDIKYNSSSYFQDLGNYAIKNEFDIEFNINFTPKQ